MVVQGICMCGGGGWGMCGYVNVCVGMWVAWVCGMCGYVDVCEDIWMCVRVCEFVGIWMNVCGYVDVSGYVDVCVNM